MSLSRKTLVLLTLATFAVAVPAAPAAPVPATAAAKKCKKGYKRVKVDKGGRKKTVCRKKRARAAGPSVVEVESIIRGIHQARHESWLGPESMEVTFERPTKVLPMRMYDPYAADPLNPSGPVQAWPVLAWVKVVNHRDDTPDDDTQYAGCLGHLNSWWPYDTLHMFFRGDSGEWTYLSSSEDEGDCG